MKTLMPLILISIIGAAQIPGQIKNVGLVNPSMTVNGVTCTLGGGCTIAAVASSVVVGTTTVSSGTTPEIFYDNAGVLGQLTNLSGYGFGLAGTEYEVSFCASGCTNAAITQAQLLNANTSPITLITAQGAGTLVFLDNVVLELVFNTSAYATNTTISYKYNNTTTIGNVNSFLAETSTFLFGNAGSGLTTATAATNAVNQPVTLSVTSGNPTCASTCGTLAVWIKYRVLSGL